MEKFRSNETARNSRTGKIFLFQLRTPPFIDIFIKLFRQFRASVENPKKAKKFVSTEKIESDRYKKIPNFL